MKYRYMIRVLIGCVLIYVLLQILLRNKGTERLPLRQVIHNTATVRSKAPIRHINYDVVLSAYMRGGSTFTGQILGYRSDSFYVYEPLWKIARWIYWKGNDTVCRSDRTECRRIAADEIPDAKLASNASPRIRGSLNLALKIVHRIYSCQFNDFERLVLSGFTADFSGPSWFSTKLCLNKKKINSKCVLENIPDVCSNASHRVTKILRLAPEHFNGLLQSRSNLKVLHLFRDPRAIINSRIETNGFAPKDIQLNAKALCEKMMHDYQQGKRLSAEFPERFRFIYYEDLKENPLIKSKAMYRYFGMSLDEDKYPAIKNLITTNTSKHKVLTEREKNNAFWWRGRLNWDIVRKIDTSCKDVYEALGYIPFNNNDLMKNLTFKSVQIPKEYVLV